MRGRCVIVGDVIMIGTDALAAKFPQLSEVTENPPCVDLLASAGDPYCGEERFHAL